MARTRDQWRRKNENITVPAMRSCTSRDLADIEHTVEVTALSLYEAVAQPRVYGPDIGRHLLGEVSLNCCRDDGGIPARLRRGRRLGGRRHYRLGSCCHRRMRAGRHGV